MEPKPDLRHTVAAMNPFAAQTEYTARTFKGLTLAADEVAGRDFEGCTFLKCDFHETKFTDCAFRDCRFVSSDLNAVGVEGCTFSQAKFEDCHLIGVNWVATTWAKSRFLLPVSFWDCALNHAIFAGLDMHEVTLTRCSARSVDFSEANLSRADCTFTHFQGSRFWHTDLTDADFSGATSYTIPPDLNILKRTRFSLPEALSLLYSMDIVINQTEE